MQYNATRGFMAKVIPELSVDVRVVFDRLVQMRVGETITYADIKDLIGRDGQNGGRSVIASARRKALNEHRMVFEPVRNEGYKRLSDADIVNTAEHDMGKVHRATRRGARRIAVVDFERLPNASKVKHNTYLSMFGAINAMTTGASVKALEKKVAETHEALPLAKTLEVFRSK